MNRQLSLRTAGAVLILACAAGLLPTLTPSAEARRGRGGRASARIRQEFILRPTRLGAPLRLKGKARTEVRRNREKVSVEVESRAMQPGSVVEVWFVNPANSTDLVFLAELTLRPNPLRPGEVRGEVEFETQDGDILPAGASPVNRITEFRVLDADTNEALLVSAPGRARGGSDDDRGRGRGSDDGEDDGRGRGRGSDDGDDDDRGRGRGRDDR